MAAHYSRTAARVQSLSHDRASGWHDGRVTSNVLKTLLLGVLLFGCDGGAPPMADAGPPPIMLTVTATAREASPRPGSVFLVLDITLESRTVGPLPVAPNAFTLILADGVRSIGNAQATDALADGCRSRSVPLGGNTSCKVVFEVEEAAAAPVRLEWSSGTDTATATVPPPV